MKLSESAAFELFDKYSLPHPKVVTTPFARRVLAKVVVKANLPMSGKKKVGLVQICDYKDVAGIAKKMGVPVIVEEFVEHKDEFFVALKAVREGVEVYYSGLGGVDVEQNWERVQKIFISTEVLLCHPELDSGSLADARSETSSEMLKQVQHDMFDLIPEKGVREWIGKLLLFFQDEDATYFEVNPFTLVGKQVMPLGVVLVLDDAAGFRHPDWPEVFDDTKTEREKRVAETDGQIKGSVKLVEVPGGGDTALMAGGGGAALFLCDAILDHGLKLADYAEFSGNPPEYAVYELAKEVLKIPGIKNLVIGSGIANFTPVVGNFKGIIQAFNESPEAKKLNIVIRRCGPEEDAAILMMKEFAKKEKFNIKVFGRETGMTEVVKKLTE